MFSVLRGLVDLFASAEDQHLGLYGAFGYDLVFQFEPMPLRLPRPDDQRDLVLYLPDEILVVDHMRQIAAVHRYEFEAGGVSTSGLPRSTPPAPYASTREPAGRPLESDHGPGEYAALVERAKEAFVRGDLFEVVVGQLLADTCTDPPSVVFHRLRQANPAPYGALINLGEGEFLVAASPEMFVRVEGRRIETCPISGTIARGRDPVEDAERIRELLNSAKDESELTMCTDVDRNDKSRVCEAGSVRVIGRRQIELYSRLIHTVDHVEGVLREEFDALDGFLSHAWAVTVTGAPKRWAIRFIEERGALGAPLVWRGDRAGDLRRQHEHRPDLAHDPHEGRRRRGPRRRYLALRQRPAGRRSRKPAEGGRDVHRDPRADGSAPPSRARPAGCGRGRQEGAADRSRGFFCSHPGQLHPHDRRRSRDDAPGSGARRTARRSPLRSRRAVSGAGPAVRFRDGPRPSICWSRASLPVFGVCLGLQGIVEFFGGSLGVLDMPMHGKPSRVRVLGGRLLRGLPEEFTVGRYHSLHALRSTLPPELAVTAETEDGVVMAVEHERLPIAAVQFHPESVMTLHAEIGLPIIAAVLSALEPEFS